MKSKIFFSNLIIIGVLLIIMIISYEFNKPIYKSYVGNSQVINSNYLTMMYETKFGSGEYQVSGDSSWPQEGYSFNEALSKCENGSKLIWNKESKQLLLEANKSDKCYVYFDKVLNYTLAEYITTQVYTGVDGENGLYYHDGTGNYTNANQEAGDNSYRYSGGTEIVNNYVCFGTNEKNCPEDNLYRIIGVFNGNIKLIKAIPASSDALGTDGAYSSSGYKYSSSTQSCSSINSVLPLSLNNHGIIAAPDPVTSGCNKWEQSDLNKVNLNTNYYNSIHASWREMIKSHNWNISGVSSSGNYGGTNLIAKTLFEDEMLSNPQYYEAKIGLMYASDYIYAKDSDYWLDPIFSIKEYIVNENTNWLFINEKEWTITNDSFNYNYGYLNDCLSFIISDGTLVVSSGNLFYSGSILSSSVHNVGVIRPCFYLDSSVMYVGGTGEKSNPYIITK